MIYNLEELIAFSKSRSYPSPLLRKISVFERPGCSVDEINAIKRALPGIPQNYLDIITAVELNDIEIGAFRLSPGPKGCLVDKLIEANQESIYPIAARLHEDGVYYVAEFDADTIGVVYRNVLFKTGQIVMYASSNLEEQATVLAENYEQFLIITGNLYSIHYKYEEVDDKSIGIPEFEACLECLLSNEQTDIKLAWKDIAIMVLY